MTTASPRARQAGAADGGSRGVHATARVRAAGGDGVTTLPLLHHDGPFHLRRLRPDGTRARVCVISAMSAPLGGDRLAFDVTVEAGAELEITTAAATLALPGSAPGHATYDVRLTVGAEATLHWLPQPLISTRGSDLRQTYTVELAPSSRLVLREELVLGRAGEPPGQVASRFIVRRDGRPLVDQHTIFGASTPGWDGPAVLHTHRATGQILVVDPSEPVGSTSVQRVPRLLGQDPAGGQGALLPLAGPAVLATAVAPTAAQLRRLLDDAEVLP